MPGEFPNFTSVMEYANRGLFQVLSRLSLTPHEFANSMEVWFWSTEKFKTILALTEEQLDNVEKALQQIKEIETSSSGPAVDEEIVDALALALERHRPGRVQAILGKTKLLYFGSERVRVLPGDLTFQSRRIELNINELWPFINIFFTFHAIAKAAVVVSVIRTGGTRIWLWLLGKTFDMFSSSETIGDARLGDHLYDVELRADGTARSTYEQNHEG